MTDVANVDRYQEVHGQGSMLIPVVRGSRLKQVLKYNSIQKTKIPEKRKVDEPCSYILTCVVLIKHVRILSINTLQYLNKA